MRRIIKIKTLSLLLFALFGVLGYGQDQNKLKVDLPNFAPPSPEAFAITKYGDVPVDEFNGKANLNIPLYEFQAGKLKLPISLNYNAAGVKVNDIPTQTGINWMLDAGGLISREVRDIPDEMAYANGTRLNLTDTQLSALNQFDCTTAAGQLQQIIESGLGTDKEADIFHFNFSGHSGSFFLDNNYLPVLAKNDSSLKIQIIGSLFTNKTFLITDENGVKYYFGGADASESTQARTVSNSGTWNLVGGGVTSFYLYKIEHPVNGTILLEYETLSAHEVALSKSYSLTKQVEIFGTPYCKTQFTAVPRFNFSGYKNEIFNKKEIKSIYSSDHNIKVTFNRSTLNVIDFKTVLNNIEIKNGSTLLHKINFIYTGLENPNSIKRFFLTKLEIDKDLNTQSSPTVKKNQDYLFEYNDLNGLPERFSKSQDILGYFNDKTNATLIPNDPTFYSFAGADRSADFEKSRKGTLTKVTYPTGGFTQFEYEPQHGLEKTYEHVGLGTCLNFDLDGNNTRTTVSHAEVPTTLPGWDNIVNTTMRHPVNYTQTVNINLSVSTLDNVPNHYATVYLKIRNLTTSHIDSLHTSSSLIVPFQFLMNNSYKIEMDIVAPQQTYSGYSASASCNFSLHDGYASTEGIGVRLKKVTDFTSANKPATTKRYYYTSFDKIGDIFSDSSPALEDFYKKTNSYSMVLCQPPSGSPGGNLPDPTFISYQTLHSDNSFSDFSFNSESLVDWSKVTVSYGGDNFEQGGEEKTFLKNEKSSYVVFEPLSPREEAGIPLSYTVPDAKTNVLSLDGLLVKSKVFKKLNGNVFKIREKTISYSFSPESIKSNVFGFKIHELYNTTCNAGLTLSNYFIGSYNTFSYDFKMTNEKTKEYIDPVPASIVPHEYSELDDPNTVYPTQEELEASYKKIKTEQSYEYGTLRGLPTKITTSTSDSTISNIVVNTYVNQANTLTGLTTAQIGAYAGLQSQNNVATPIQVSQYENTELLTTQRTLYNQDANYLIHPEIIQTAKGSQDLEDRVLFEEYDAKGNPTLFSYKGGTKVKYLYNSNNQVYLKIENFTGTLDPNTNPLSSDPCTFMSSYPNAIITVYTYDPVTNLVTQTMDSNCRKTTYVYDEFYRLKQIKDHDGNIIKEFDNNYRPQ